MFFQQPLFLANPNLRYHYHDINNGFTPTGGTTNFLKSLVPSFARYISLTGQSMTAEALKANNAILHITDKKDEIYSAAFHHDDIHDKDLTYDMVNEVLFSERRANHIENKSNFYTSLENEFAYRTHFGENSGLVYAELFYKMKVFEFENYSNNNSLNHFAEYECYDPNNVFAHTVLPIIMQIAGVNNDDTPKIDFYLKSLKNVFECFRFDTLEEIENSLKEKISSGKHNEVQWAKETLKKFNSKSKPAQQLTLEMLKRSDFLSWRDTLQMEYRVACRRSLDKDFVEKTPNGDKSKLSNDHLESYFRPLAEDLKINEIGENTHKNSLHPKKDFVEFPEFALDYLNAPNDSVFRLREANNPQLNTFLGGLGIDVNADSFSRDALLQKLNEFKNLERRWNNQCKSKLILGNEFGIFLYSHELQEKFKQDCKDEIQKINEMGDKELQVLKSNYISKAFERKIDNDLKWYEKNSEIAGEISKSGNYAEIKKIIDQRLLNYIHKSDSKSIIKFKESLSNDLHMWSEKEFIKLENSIENARLDDLFEVIKKGISNNLANSIKNATDEIEEVKKLSKLFKESFGKMKLYDENDSLNNALAGLCIYFKNLKGYDEFYRLFTGVNLSDSLKDTVLVQILTEVKLVLKNYLDEHLHGAVNMDWILNLVSPDPKETEILDYLKLVKISHIFGGVHEKLMFSLSAVLMEKLQNVSKDLDEGMFRILTGVNLASVSLPFNIKTFDFSQYENVAYKEFMDFLGNYFKIQDIDHSKMSSIQHFLNQTASQCAKALLRARDKLKYEEEKLLLNIFEHKNFVYFRYFEEEKSISHDEEFQNKINFNYSNSKLLSNILEKFEHLNNPNLNFSNPKLIADQIVQTLTNIKSTSFKTHNFLDFYQKFTKSQEYLGSLGNKELVLKFSEELKKHNISVDELLSSDLVDKLEDIVEDYCDKFENNVDQQRDIINHFKIVNSELEKFGKPFMSIVKAYFEILRLKFHIENNEIEEESTDSTQILFIETILLNKDENKDELQRKNFTEEMGFEIMDKMIKSPPREDFFPTGYNDPFDEEYKLDKEIKADSNKLSIPNKPFDNEDYFEKPNIYNSAAGVEYYNLIAKENLVRIAIENIFQDLSKCEVKNCNDYIRDLLVDHEKYFSIFLGGINGRSNFMKLKLDLPNEKIFKAPFEIAGNKWIEGSLTDVFFKFLSIRREVEPLFNDSELEYLDYELDKILDRNFIVNKLRENLEFQINTIEEIRKESESDSMPNLYNGVKGFKSTNILKSIDPSSDSYLKMVAYNLANSGECLDILNIDEFINSSVNPSHKTVDQENFRDVIKELSNKTKLEIITDDDLEFQNKLIRFPHEVTVILEEEAKKYPDGSNFKLDLEYLKAMIENNFIFQGYRIIHEKDEKMVNNESEKSEIPEMNVKNVENELNFNSFENQISPGNPLHSSNKENVVRLVESYKFSRASILSKQLTMIDNQELDSAENSPTLNFFPDLQDHNDFDFEVPRRDNLKDFVDSNSSENFFKNISEKFVEMQNNGFSDPQKYEELMKEFNSQENDFNFERENLKKEMNIQDSNYEIYDSSLSKLAFEDRELEKDKISRILEKNIKSGSDSLNESDGVVEKDDEIYSMKHLSKFSKEELKNMKFENFNMAMEKNSILNEGDSDESYENLIEDFNREGRSDSSESE